MTQRFSKDSKYKVNYKSLSHRVSCWPESEAEAYTKLGMF